LSGGEQQMLGLGKAFILRPSLLLIDELSLGLAPKIVSELLEMVRRINADGTAVVLVEQSVNVALSLVDHAYFMEKGEIRFDGGAKDLLKRTDLLRSVFLKGAAAGLGKR
jgi:ABC-type branched-subunit amino acid transport system ATPase component